MSGQLLLGVATSLCNIAVHAFVMLPVLLLARTMAARRRSWSSLWLIVTMAVTVAILMTAHILEVFVWALVYLLFDVASPESGLLYFAFVNYTTLGYGDVIPNPRWRLLGPITAANGVLLFGWSTAVIFEVLRRALPLAYPELHRED